MRKSTAFRNGKDILENISVRNLINEVITDKIEARDVLVLYALHKYQYMEFGEHKIDFRKFITFCKDMDIDYYSYSNSLVFKLALSRAQEELEDTSLSNMSANTQETFLYKICAIDEVNDVLERSVSYLVYITTLFHPSLKCSFCGGRNAK